ncbi:MULTISPECIES: hypothetical protein [Sinorhizobium]|uniref:hypothetical protein n=1 Tax=Sinorhizobium TaxID=28105 RepID=UPI000BE78F2C|nr:MULTISPECIES: hypothetical protein [Sinorhizobium]PDT50044.1 hypothetical protein CO664_26365 [Sinorhizobium sp. NG07B]POH33691.1 hypothetical protein ATY30_01520 [Sinorhizobium americanum]
MFRAAVFAACLWSLLPSFSAYAEVLIDVEAENVRAAVGETTLDDLSINDSVHIYKNYCIKDQRLYIPGWANPANLAASKYSSEGVLLKAVVLPGKKLKMTYVDAAHAQAVAKGNTSAPAVLSTDDYNKHVREDINRIFDGGLFGTVTCEEEQRQNPLRQMNLFEVESINGFNSLSELLKSVSKAN